jgi:hypothetical protein
MGRFKPPPPPSRTTPGGEIASKHDWEQWTDKVYEATKHMTMKEFEEYQAKKFNLRGDK